MADTETKAVALPQILPAGGEVQAIVPQTIEEIFRVSKGIAQSGLAPYALTGVYPGKPVPETKMAQAVSAIAVTIMSGAELGLPAMVALRSFTVINGRPALYGDGLINVVRRSGKAKRLKVGFEPGKSDTFGDDAFGYCEAERIDTGETHRVQFSVAQAKRAGLWETEAMVEREVWDGPEGQRRKVKRTVPNDSPWYRYPERMLGWRAAGFCLRELFGDVLGGITDDWEAREFRQPEMRDVTPPSQELPHVPGMEDTKPETPTADTPTDPMQTQEAAAGGEEGSAPEPATPPRSSEATAFLANLESALENAETQDEVLRIFEEADVQSHLDSIQITDALALRNGRISQLKADLEAAGQGTLLPPDVPEGEKPAEKAFPGDLDFPTGGA